MNSFFKITVSFKLACDGYYTFLGTTSTVETTYLVYDLFTPHGHGTKVVQGMGLKRLKIFPVQTLPKDTKA